MRETTFDVPTDVAHLLIVLENWYNEACRNQKRFGEPPFEKVMVWRSAEKGINYTLAPGARRLGFDFHGVPQDHRFSYRDLVHVDAYELSGQLTRLTLRGKYQ